jgi:hypothetical protein
MKKNTSFCGFSGDHISDKLLLEYRCRGIIDQKETVFSIYSDTLRGVKFNDLIKAKLDEISKYYVIYGMALKGNVLAVASCCGGEDNLDIFDVNTGEYLGEESPPVGEDGNWNLIDIVERRVGG